MSEIIEAWAKYYGYKRNCPCHWRHPKPGRGLVTNRALMKLCSEMMANI